MTDKDETALTLIRELHGIDLQPGDVWASVEISEQALGRMQPGVLSTLLDRLAMRARCRAGEKMALGYGTILRATYSPQAIDAFAGRAAHAGAQPAYADRMLGLAVVVLRPWS